MWLLADLDGLVAGAEQVLRDEAERSTADHWKQIAAEDRALGIHANADELPFHDTSAGMWEDGGE